MPQPSSSTRSSASGVSPSVTVIDVRRRRRASSRPAPSRPRSGRRIISPAAILATTRGVEPADGPRPLRSSVARSARLRSVTRFFLSRFCSAGRRASASAAASHPRRREIAQAAPVTEPAAIAPVHAARAAGQILDLQHARSRGPSGENPNAVTVEPKMPRTGRRARRPDASAPSRRRPRARARASTALSGRQRQPEHRSAPSRPGPAGSGSAGGSIHQIGRSGRARSSRPPRRSASRGYSFVRRDAPVTIATAVPDGDGEEPPAPAAAPPPLPRGDPTSPADRSADRRAGEPRRLRVALHRVRDARTREPVPQQTSQRRAAGARPHDRGPRPQAPASRAGTGRSLQVDDAIGTRRSAPVRTSSRVSSRRSGQPGRRPAGSAPRSRRQSSPSACRARTPPRRQDARPPASGSARARTRPRRPRAAPGQARARGAAGRAPKESPGRSRDHPPPVALLERLPGSRRRRAKSSSESSSVLRRRSASIRS